MPQSAVLVVPAAPNLPGWATEGLLRVGPRHPTWCLSSLRLSLFVGLGASDTEVVQVCMSERAPAGLVFVGILLASIGACTSGRA